MSLTSSEFSEAESEGVPDLYGSRKNTLSTDSECFNRLDVFNAGTMDVYGETDEGREMFSLSSGSSEDETEESLVSLDSYSDNEGSILSTLKRKVLNGLITQDRRCQDGLGWQSISSMSYESLIGHRPPIYNKCPIPFYTPSSSVEAALCLDSMDVHSDKEASSIGVPPVDYSAENHVSLKKRVKNGICAFFKRAWKAVKHPLLCCENTVEPFVPPPDDTETYGDDSLCFEDTSCFESPDESDKSGYEIGTFDDDCGVIPCGPFSIKRRNPVRRLGEWSFDRAGGRDNSPDLLTISSGISSTEKQSGAWQNGPARETDCGSMYTTGSSMSLEEQSDKKATSADTVENSTKKHTTLRKKIKKRISSFFKKARNMESLETRVEPFVPLDNDSETDSEPDHHKPYFVAEPFGFKPTDAFQQFDRDVVIIGSGGAGCL